MRGFLLCNHKRNARDSQGTKPNIQKEDLQIVTQAATVSQEKPNYLTEPDWFEQFDREVSKTIIALGNDSIQSLLGVGPERVRIYVKHINSFGNLFKEFGWIYPPVKIELGRKSAKPKGLMRSSVRILYVFKKLIDTTDELTAIEAIYPTVKELYARHYGR